MISGKNILILKIMSRFGLFQALAKSHIKPVSTEKIAASSMSIKPNKLLTTRCTSSLKLCLNNAARFSAIAAILSFNRFKSSFACVLCLLKNCLLIKSRRFFTNKTAKNLTMLDHIMKGFLPSIV